MLPINPLLYLCPSRFLSAHLTRHGGIRLAFSIERCRFYWQAVSDLCWQGPRLLCFLPLAVTACSTHCLVLAHLVAPRSLNQHSGSTTTKTHALMLERCFSSKASPLRHLHIPRGIPNTRLAKASLRPICRGLWRHLAPWFSLAAAPIYLSLQYTVSSLGKAKDTFPAKTSLLSTETCGLEKGRKIQMKDKKETEEKN